MRRGSTVATAAAFATLIAAPLVPGVIMMGTPAVLLSLSAESIAVLLILLSVRSRSLRGVFAGIYGAIVVTACLIAALDLGFRATVARAFSLTDDIPAVTSAFGVVADAAGTGVAIVMAALIVVLMVGAGVAVARAALRAGRVTRASGRTGRVAVTAVTAAWIVCALAGAQLPSGAPVAASAATDTLAATSTGAVASIAEQRAFERALESDRLRGIPDDDLLVALDGKDVVFAFLESYGRVAVQDATSTGVVERALQEGGARLARDGYAARSAFLTSPTFGGISWLAHATLQSGVWIDSQPKYDRLTAHDRLTLSRAFARAGWRTVAVVPSNDRDWEVGASFYRYDAVHDARNMGYRGPEFSYARMPDQYTWKRFYDRELAGAHRPIMAEIDLVSSHTPWTPLARLLPWSRIGDGSVFHAQAAEGPHPLVAWSDEQRVRELYGESIAYALETMFSFVRTYGTADLVLIVLGDHQPATIVSGPDAGRDVPVTIIAKDPAVFEKIESWRWEVGVHPSPAAPVWRMDLFRDRFIDAFSD